ncbi:MAG: AraC family transcriptional regulator [Victivallaceae bacterium]|nr:AraC family transcriptional regulator [Victivallaceae bacterium]
MIYLHKHIKELVTVSHYSAPPNQEIQSHEIAKETECIELLSGGEVIFNNQRYRRGTLFWHAAGDSTVHRYPAGDPYSCFVFKFSVRAQEKRLIPRISGWNNLDMLDETCEEILRCFHNDNYDNKIIGPYAYATLYWQVYRSGIRQTAPRSHKAVRRAIKFIHNHSTDDLLIKDIAEAAGVSEPHLYLLFRQHLGNTPHQYILMQRLQHARRLLVSSNDSIKEVGFDCGFSNSESFHRAFRKKYEMTPGEYRNYHMPQ